VKRNYPKLNLQNLNKQKRMRKNLNKLAKLFFGISIVLLLANCEQNEPLSLEGNTQNASIQEARGWFESYKQEVAFDTIFKNLEYHWEKASLKMLADSTRAITVPVISTKQALDYRGEKVLYLYPKEDQAGFNTTLFETMPDKKYFARNGGKINLNTFDGYIIRWDLEYGFDSGTKFVNGQPTEDIDLKMIKTTVGGLSVTGKLTDVEEEPIELREVRVTGAGGGKDTSSYGIAMSIVSLKGISAYNGGAGAYTGGAYGGGGSGGNTPSPKPNPEYDKTPCDKLKAQIKNAGYKLRLADLKNNTGLTFEKGYKHQKGNAMPELKRAQSTTSTDGLIFDFDSETIGYMHTHQDTYEDEVHGIRKGHQIFSPADIKNFLILVATANRYKTPQEDVYGIVVTSTGNYELKFTGSLAGQDVNKDWKGNAMNEAYVKSINDNGLEKGLLTFIKNYLGITGIELFKIEENGDYSSITVVNGTKVSISCEDLKKGI
jgi:hypothetical protein